MRYIHILWASRANDKSAGASALHFKSVIRDAKMMWAKTQGGIQKLNFLYLYLYVK